MTRRRGMTRRRRWIGSIAGVAMLGLGGSAAGHPHVYIDNTTTFQFAGGKLVALKLRWVFDELFSATVIDQFDTDKDGRFDAKERAALEQGAFANLREYAYFTYLTVDGDERAAR